MASTNTSIPLVYAIWIAFLLFFGSVQLCLCFNGNSSGSGGCIARERKALLSIRKGIYDAHRWLSWNGKDCCRWRGVRCDTVTGHVAKLDLHYPYDVEYPDKSEVSPSLLHLRYLNHLDLTMNNFGGAPIPDFIGSLAKLEYLDLSNAWFGGTIPHQLGNLTNLLYLDLTSFSPHFLDVDNLGWLPSIRFLQHLDMSYVDLSKASNWIHVINMLPSLSVLRLSGATLPSLPSTLPHVNFTSLTTLDLSGNYFASSIPGWLFNLSSLELLDLGSNNFYGNIPLAIGNLQKLQVLDLSSNNFSGDIPETVWSLKSLLSIDLSMNSNGGYGGRIPETVGNGIGGRIPETVGNLKSLMSLDLSYNNISGHIPETVGNLKSLVSLDLSNNGISGRIPETVWNLKSLETLDLSSNNISGRIPETVGNLKSLETLDLSSNNISGEIPKIIGRLTKLQNLWLHDNQISGEIPETIGNLGELSSLDLSRNRINGQIPSAVGNLCNLSNLIAFDNNIGGTIAGFMEGFSRCSTNRLRKVSLQQNNLSGPLPSQIGELQSLGHLDLGALTEAHFANLTRLSFSGTISYDALISTPGLIDLSNNSFSGPIPPTWGGGFDYLASLLLAHNRFNGSIPSAFCEANSLKVLNLADNDLSGVVPNCWNNSSHLGVIDFSDNKLSGGIPSSMGSLSQLMSLHLRDNNFSGKIPLSLQQCKQLTTIDFGNNKFSGCIPEWIGGSLLSLRVLRLRSNMLDGNISKQLSLLASLQVLDLADNKLSGTLPPSFGNFKAMITTQNGSEPILSENMASYYTENIQINTKSLELTFTSVLSLVTSLDLSDNNISGEIPEEFTNLRGLHSLNLSGNHLTGRIPFNIGAMGQLESLDLSMNNLSSTIPTSITDLNFLARLNLSHNNLSGRIPSGNQLQTLNDSSIYIGNQYLCGQPLPEKCPGDEPAEGPIEEKQDENGSEMIWLYVGLSPGVVVGFWGFFAAVMLKRSTRYAYIQFIDRICDWIYMAATINFTRPKSKRNRGRRGRT